MTNKISINGHDLKKTQINSTEYQISVFLNEILDFQFHVSLQPPSKEDLLPAYQLTDKSQNIPEWTKMNLNVISDWILSENK